MPHVSLQTCHSIQNARPLLVLKSVVGVPLCDLIVAVVLDFENHAGSEDNLAAALLQNHDITEVDSEAFASRGGQGDPAATGHDKRLWHVGVPHGMTGRGL